MCFSSSDREQYPPPRPSGRPGTSQYYTGTNGNYHQQYQSYSAPVKSHRKRRGGWSSYGGGGAAAGGGSSGCGGGGGGGGC